MKINKNYRESRRRNKKYWEERARARSDVFVEDSEKIADELGKAYYSSSKIVEKEIAKVFQGFENAFGLSHAEAKRLIENAASDVPSKELIGIINGLTDNDLKQQLLGYISAPAYQYRIKRLDEAVARAEKVCKSLYSSELHTDTEFFSSEIEKAYNHTIFDIQQGTGITGAFNQIPKSRIEEIMKNRWSGRHYSSRIWGNTSRLAQTLKNNLLESFITGESEQKAAARVRERFGVAANNARCLVRTENTYITNQAEISGYKEAQVDEYEYMAVMDDDTSTICRRLNGRSFPVSKARAGFNLPPMHPFCRSTTIGKIPSEEELDAVWDKDMADMVPEGMDFEEWLDGLEATEDGKLVFRDKRVDKSGKSGIIETERAMAAKTFDKAAEYAKKKLNVSISSLSELPLRTVNAINNSISKLYKDVPSLSGIIDEILVDDIDEIAKSSLGWVDGSPRIRLKLSRTYFANMSIDKLEQVISDLADAGVFTPKNGISGIVQHEAVHLAEFQQTIKRYGCNKNAVEKSLDSFELARELKELALKNCSLDDTSNTVNGMLCSYASINSAEFLAEGYSSTNSNPLTNEIKRLLRKKWGM